MWGDPKTTITAVSQTLVISSACILTNARILEKFKHGSEAESSFVHANWHIIFYHLPPLSSDIYTSDPTTAHSTHRPCGLSTAGARAEPALSGLGHVPAQNK